MTRLLAAVFVALLSFTAHAQVTTTAAANPALPGSSGTTTGSGAVVLQTSPALVTPTINGRSVVEIVCQSGVSASGVADTNENAAYTCAIPANSVGANGRIRYVYHVTKASSGNTCTARVRLGGIGGTVLHTFSVSTNVPIILEGQIAARNSTTSQITTPRSFSAGGAVSAAHATSTAALTSAQDLVLSLQRGSAGEACTLESALVEIMYGA